MTNSFTVNTFPSANKPTGSEEKRLGAAAGWVTGGRGSSATVARQAGIWEMPPQGGAALTKPLSECWGLFPAQPQAPESTDAESPKLPVKSPSNADTRGWCLK